MAIKRLLPIVVCILTFFVSGSTTQAQQGRTFWGPLGISFVDTQHGWMLSNYAVGNQAEEIAVDRTTDSGQTWQTEAVIGTPVSPDDFYNSESVSDLRFANSLDGWAFGPDLYATHDGGKTWQKDPDHSHILALQIAKGTIWMIQKMCNDPDQCNDVLVVSKDNGQSWQSINVMSPGILAIGLTVLDAQSAWVMYYGLESGLGTATPDGDHRYGFGVASDYLHLRATHDSGNIWQSVSFPAECDDGSSEGHELAAVDLQHLWLACGDWGYGIHGGKRILTSVDGGKSWQLKAWANMDPQPNDTMSDIGFMEHFYAFSPRTAWMTLGRNSPILTRNGGITWTGTDLDLNVGDSGGDRRLTWVDPLHIWYYSDRWLFHTTDGGKTWIMQRQPGTES